LQSFKLYIIIRSMKKLLFPIVLLVVVLTLFSCGSTKNVAYFKNADTINLAASKGLYDAKIMPKDMLTITVSATDPKAAAPFNLVVQDPLRSNGSLASYSGSLLPYLVDNDGFINFPVIGMVKVAGLTKRQCEDLLHDKIKPYMAATEKPIVTVKMASFTISVLGEVARPGQFSVETEKISILQALANAGDLTIYGKRENVLLVREDASGEKSVHRINLNDANLINSPYYYLQQNDALIVEPNKAKAQNSSIGQMTTLWFSGASILISVASLVVNITR